MKSLNSSIQESEGFRSTPCIDVLVKASPENYGITKRELEVIEKNLKALKLTFGYGFTFLTKEEAEVVLKFRIDSILKELETRAPIVKTLPVIARDILVEMCFQLGVSGVLKFKRMWSAINVKDFEQASKEMLDSQWAKQMPSRAKLLSSKMKAIGS